MSGLNKPESVILQEIRLALGQQEDFVAWRNNTGMSIIDNRPVQFGLCKGSSDIIGILLIKPTDKDLEAIKFIRSTMPTLNPLHIDTLNHIIRKLTSTTGRYIALEAKTDRGRLTEYQRIFLNLVRNMGGFAAVIRSADEGLSALDRARDGLYE